MGQPVNWLLDTNILIDYLQGREDALRVLSAPEARFVSIVTWMEVLVGAQTDAEEAQLKHWMQLFEIVPVDDEIAQGAVQLRRRQQRLRLPDAIIWSSAQTRSLILVTRNTRDFPESTPGVHCPY